MKSGLVKILVIDDDRRTRTLLEEYLREMGFDVAVAEDAAQVEPVLAKQKIDLLVLDLMLPGEDGLSLCRRLRGNEVDVPIIMLTAKGSDVDRIVGLEVGADDYLPKPFNPRDKPGHAKTRQGRSLATFDNGRICCIGSVAEASSQATFPREIDDTRTRARAWRL